MTTCNALTAFTSYTVYTAYIASTACTAYSAVMRSTGLYRNEINGPRLLWDVPESSNWTVRDCTGKGVGTQLPKT